MSKKYLVTAYPHVRKKTNRAKYYFCDMEIRDTKLFPMEEWDKLKWGVYNHRHGKNKHPHIKIILGTCEFPKGSGKIWAAVQRIA